MSARAELGSWTCPSGNNVVAYLRTPDGAGVRHLDLEWDSPPPLSLADQVYYDGVILPAVTRRAQEYLERPGHVLVIRP